jgi:hypothetical protein
LVALEKLNCAVDFKKVFGDKFVLMLEQKKTEVEEMRAKIQKL